MSSTTVVDTNAAERRAIKISLRLDTIADNYEAVMPMIREAIELGDHAPPPVVSCRSPSPADPTNSDAGPAAKPGPASPNKHQKGYPMTSKTVDWSTGNAQKMPGWHSWRHQTREAQDTAREVYLSRRGRAARRARAAARSKAVA